MARSEGFEVDIPEAELDHHLAECAGCREELAELARLNSRFGAVQRVAAAVDVWPQVVKIIAKPRTLRRYLLLGALLGAGKLFEMFTGRGAPLTVEFLLAMLAGIVLFLSRKQLFSFVSEVSAEGDAL
jgi:hypothetical protein